MSVIEKAPGPSPWYLRFGDPPAPGYTWRDFGVAGAIALFGPDGPLLVLDFHNYVLPLDSGTMLIWHQAHVECGPTAPVVLRIFSLHQLTPVTGQLDEICATMRRETRPFAAAVQPLSEMGIPTTVVGEPRALAFDDRLRHLNELLILCRSSGIEEEPAGDRENLALMVASPAASKYQLFPQDWYNRGGFDYVYQGVTRVARDPGTGQIHGEGFRIEPFVLDRTCRRRMWRER